MAGKRRIGLWAGLGLGLLFVSLGVVFWAKGEADAARSAEEGFGQAEVSTEPPIGESAGEGPAQGAAAIHVSDAQGRPMDDVRIFAGFALSDPAQAALLQDFGHSDEKGLAPASHYPVVVGLASDGRLAINPKVRTVFEYTYADDGEHLDRKSQQAPPNRLRFGPTKTLSLRFTGSKEKPLSDRKVCLFPALEDTGSLKGVGIPFKTPDYEKEVARHLTAVTDANGVARFVGLPKESPFVVLLQMSGGLSLRLAGTIRPGGSAAIRLPDDRAVRGRFTHAITGAPLAGIKVGLRISDILQSWDAEDTLYASTTTDAKGEYRFDALPNGRFYVDVLELPGIFGKRAYVESRRGAEPWRDRGWMEWPKQDGPVHRESHEGTPVSTADDSTIDFRMFDFARLIITTDGPRGASLAISDALPGEGTGSGSDFHAGRHWYEEEHAAFLMRPGVHRLRLSGFASARRYEVGTVTLQEGEDREISIAIPKRPEFTKPAVGADRQQSGGKPLDFRVLGSDGRRYDRDGLARNGPVLIFNLSEGGLPLGVPLLNRLAARLEGKIRVVGYVTDVTDVKGMRRLIRQQSIRFPLLAPIGDDSVRGEISQMLGDDRTRTYLANGLLLPNGLLTHIWTGFNRFTLRQMALDYERSLGRPLGVDFADFPKEIIVGEGGMYGLPGPD